MEQKIEVLKDMVITLHRAVQAQGALLAAACECLPPEQRQVLASGYRMTVEQLLAQTDGAPVPDAAKAELTSQINIYLSRLEG